MDFNEPAVRREGRLRRIGRGAEPAREVAHQGRHFRRRGKGVPAGVGHDIAALIGVAAGNLGMRALHDEMMQLADVGLGQRRPLRASART